MKKKRLPLTGKIRNQAYLTETFLQEELPEGDFPFSNGY